MTAAATVSSWAWAALQWVPLAGLVVSATAATMTVVNLQVYRRAQSDGGAPGGAPDGARDGARGGAPGSAQSAPASPQPLPSVSVCIPARNEARNIRHVVGSALASGGVDLQVLVYDDESTDVTPALVRQLVAEDSRVKSVATRQLPTGWNGKQWACQRMGEAAVTEWLLFTDADVRLAPDCLRRAVACANSLKADLLSTVPKQETGTLAERIVVPLIHWMLLSWLPMPRMRATNDPSTSAGCGQFLLVRREAWLRSGGHTGFADSMHDGIKLPRQVRRAGGHTDLFDGTDVVTCRMYEGAGQVWRGFTKNAFEGLGSPILLAVFTVLELLTLAPWVCLATLGYWTDGGRMAIVAAVALQVVQRALMARRFGQSWVSVVLHPLGIAALIAIQWASWWKHLRGQRSWKGRVAAQAIA
jgi:hypothetical protein